MNNKTILLNTRKHSNYKTYRTQRKTDSSEDIDGEEYDDNHKKYQ